MGERNHIGQLKPDARNARRHTPRNVGTIVAALHEVGAARSIVIDENDVILAGNATVEAAGQAGIERLRVVDADGDEVIAVRRRNLTPEQKRRLALFDNRAAELAEWDEGVIAGLVEDTDLSGIFTDDELHNLLAALDEPKALGDPDAVPDPPAEPITKPGDLWLLGEHRLLCGDSTYRDQADRVLAGAKADMVFTDPPYGVNVTGKGGDAIAGDISFTAIPLMFQVLDHVLAPQAWVYVCGGQSNMPLYSRLFEHHFRQLPPVIVWDKGKTAVMRRNGWHSCYEFVYFAFREGSGGRWFTGRTSDEADDIWRLPTDNDDDRVHPTQKPVEVPARATRATCPPGGLVFEPFAGSGSTLIACEQEGRRCAAIEMDPRFCDVIVERWQTFTGNQAVRETA